MSVILLFLRVGPKQNVTLLCALSWTAVNTQYPKNNIFRDVTAGVRLKVTVLTIIINVLLFIYGTYYYIYS